MSRQISNLKERVLNLENQMQKLGGSTSVADHEKKKLKEMKELRGQVEKANEVARILP